MTVKFLLPWARIFLICSAISCLSSARAPAAEFELKNGDRVVLVGSALIEQEQRYGYWETAMTVRNPDKNITFRNLGWSGDTVFGESRAGFDPPAEGLRRLKEHVLALKPTVIIIGYGTNESFEGEKALPKFRQGFNTLLDALAPTKARMILLSPFPRQDFQKPALAGEDIKKNPMLRAKVESQESLLLYAKAMEAIAKQRSLAYVDFAGYGLWPVISGKLPLSANGIHLTAYGYWMTAPDLMNNPRMVLDKIEIGSDGTPDAGRSKLQNIQTDPLRFELTDAHLPYPPPPVETKESPQGRFLIVKGMPEGKYVVKVNGKGIIKAQAYKELGGLFARLDRGPEFDQVEKLRAAIVKKNRLYFHRWRPQNETYLFGFRKHEQGRNAVEIPQFDPLVEEAEKEIARLRVPATHRYGIVREER